MDISIFSKDNPMEEHYAENLVNFLHTHLEQYGDDKVHIRRCLDYAMEHIPSPGGCCIVASIEASIVGVTIINKTGMGGYIPENILVYIATDRSYRGRGIGKRLMEAAIDSTEGDIALHVEANNPAKRLYERLGFTNPYLEMRWKREQH